MPDDNRATRVLVTGHAGFAGRHLVAALGERGCAVWGLDRAAAAGGAAGPAATGLDSELTGDITDFEFLRRAVREARPALVLHLAAITFGKPSGPEDRRFFAVNVEGTRLLLEALLAEARPGAQLPRLLVTGSSAAYGAPPRAAQPITESATLRPQTLYAASKVCQEIVALTYHRSHGLPVVVTRAFNHSGPGEQPHFAASSFARQIAEIEAGRRQPPLRAGNLEAWRDFTDVRDIVRGYLAAAFEGTPGECYNVCSGVARCMRAVLDGLRALARVEVLVATDPERMQPSDVPYQCGSAGKLRAATGWQPAIPFEQTLAELLDDWRRRVARATCADDDPASTAT